MPNTLASKITLILISPLVLVDCLLQAVIRRALLHETGSSWKPDVVQFVLLLIYAGLFYLLWIGLWAIG